MHAAIVGHRDICELLLSYGANINTKDTYNGKTPLMLAAENGNRVVCAVLVTYGADVNAVTTYVKRETALMLAAKKG